MSDNVQAFNYGVISSVIPQLGKGVELPAKDFSFVIRGDKYSISDLLADAYWNGKTLWLRDDITGAYEMQEDINYTVSWGDGTESVISIIIADLIPGTDVRQLVKDTLSHTYPEDNEWTITIKNYKSGYIMLSGGVRYANTYGTGNGIIRVLSPLPENPRRTDYSDLFWACDELVEIPENLFSNCYNALSFDSCFMECEKLAVIPEKLFWNCPDAEDMSWVFSWCLSLQNISENVFRFNTKVKDFSGVFRFADLSEVPEKIFWNCPDVYSFNNVLSENYNLTHIPANLFMYNTKVTNFDWAFFDDLNISKIPAGLFRNNPLVDNAYGLFCIDGWVEEFDSEGNFVRGYASKGAGKISSIPAGLFDAWTELRLADLLFAGTSIQSIPQGLFKNCKKITQVGGAFCRSYLKSIPEDLFWGCTQLSSFNATFTRTDISEIPPLLFRDQPMGYFAYAFRQCQKLQSIPEDLFSDIVPGSYSFELYATFMNCLNLKGIAPAWWLKKPTPNGYYCFSNDTLLSNWDDIPANWKLPTVVETQP